MTSRFRGSKPIRSRSPSKRTTPYGHSGRQPDWTLLSPLAVVPPVRSGGLRRKAARRNPHHVLGERQRTRRRHCRSTSVDGVASPGRLDARRRDGAINSPSPSKARSSPHSHGHRDHGSVLGGASACGRRPRRASDGRSIRQLHGPAAADRTADTATCSTPKLTKGGIKFTSLAGGGAHFCGTTPTCRSTAGDQRAGRHAECLSPPAVPPCSRHAPPEQHRVAAGGAGRATTTARSPTTASRTAGARHVRSARRR